MENRRLIDKIMSDEGLTMEEIIAGAAKENQIHLKNMNGFEQHFFKMGLDEGIRIAVEILEEVKEQSRR